MLPKSIQPSRLRNLLIRHPGAIVGTSAAFALVMLGLFTMVLWQGRSDALSHAIDTSRNIGLMVERDITRTFQLYDLSLQAVVDGVQDPIVMQMPVKYRDQILFDRASTAGEYLGEMLYVDKNGHIVVDSTSIVPRRGNLADREWFQVHRDHPEMGLAISHPYHSLLRKGAPSLALSRRVNAPDGSFAGVVVGTISLDYFRNLLTNLNLGTRGAATLMQPDGTLIMRYPYEHALIGRTLQGTPNYGKFISTDDGHFFGTAALDGVRRLQVYKRFSKIPLLINVAPAEKDIYAAWAQRAAFSISVALLLTISFFVTAILLSREFRHGLKIEADLRLLSRTDGLTGLSNRRNLDDVLAMEWQRAKRTGKALSLLFIDIDRFKAYNDAYGHQAGDDALAAVARAINKSIHRPGDSAARYGGEEFAVVLPETGCEGAAAVAAAIHRAVQALRIEHRISEHRYITVSIGGACWAGEPVPDILHFMRMADNALYRAKSDGRNTTCGI